MPHRGCQRAGAGAEVMRWITEATESARTLHGRCQRAEAGRGDAMGRRGDGFDPDAPLADVNGSEACFDEATDHRGNGLDADAASQMSTRRARAEVRR